MAFFMGYLCPAALALLCLDRFGTLHGGGIWVIHWSYLVLGFGFRRFLGMRGPRHGFIETQQRSLFASTLVPLAGSLAAIVILSRFNPAFPAWPIILNIYLGLTFSLFSRRLSDGLRAVSGLGGLGFPLAFSLAWFTGPQDLDLLLISALLFILGFLDGDRGETSINRLDSPAQVSHVD